MKDAIPEKDIQEIIQGRHNAPRTILGPHYSEEKDTITIRTLVPYADQVFVLREDNPEIKYQMDKTHKDGFFELAIPGETSGFKYRFHVIDKGGNSRIFHDPYSFTSSNFSDFDRHLYAHGNHYRLFEKLGAHPMVNDGIKGVTFAVWAPNAERVSVVAPFNRWDGRCHQMELLDKSGVWEIFIPDLCEGEFYKYEIRAKNGDVLLKSDPYAFYTETPPNTASIVYDLEGKHTWNDGKWMK